jgi:hypothetical protein
MMTDDLVKLDSTVIEALLLAVRGYAVFPCVPRGKTPITTHGCKAATAKARVIQRWWQREPSANIGLATGAASGIFVLDVDPEHAGAESLADLEADHGGLPRTITSVTGSGGRHLLFRHPGGDCKVRNLVGFRAGLDIRGDGGYIIVPPSVHPNGRRYQWAPDNPSQPAEAPAWLLQIVSEREPAAALPRGTPGVRPRSSRYVAAALRSACRRVASAPPGTRNSALNAEAFGIGQLVGAGLLDEEAVGAGRDDQRCRARRGPGDAPRGSVSRRPPPPPAPRPGRPGRRPPPGPWRCRRARPGTRPRGRAGRPPPA